jgi:hypothetical protein
MTFLLVIPSLIVIKMASGSQSGPTPDLNALSDTDLKSVTISLERTQCYGSCPAYTLTIHGDGRVEYGGQDHVKVKGARTGRVEPGAIKTLMSEFARAKFLSLPGDYEGKKCTCRTCTDMASAITVLTVGGVTHRVKHYYGCACWPKELFELESSIDKAAHSEQWTGDVSKQGPFGTTCWGQ